MRKRSSMDVNEIAAQIVEEATQAANAGKNPLAVILGRAGGLRGGKARASRLSSRRRKQIAKKAAEARWLKNGNKSG